MITGFFCAIALCALSPGHVLVGNTHDALGASPVYENLPAFGVEQVAVYVDNEVPNQGAVVAKEQQAGWKVIAGIPQGEPQLAYPGAISALEWYPYWGGKYHLGGLPPARAYILQDTFSWDGVPPTRLQVRDLTWLARQQHPELILYY